ncbi:MAG TPA: pilus assembly protein PilP [Vicinamibacterales bacterium]|nr:pilus assembly protein PilP [Vicinamibacterales bacterium]
MRTRLLLVVAVVVSAGALAGAQQQPAKPPAATPAAQPKPQDLPVIEPGYAYDPKGRRDPFISLLGRGDESKPQEARPAGIAGVLIGEVSVKGVLRDRGGYMAMIQGPDKKTHTVRVGDKLLDGSVKSITQEQVVFSQDVNDPLSLVKQREVAKPVRPAEGRG